MITVAELFAHYPFIPWTAPLPARLENGLARLCCRICIAQVGLKGEDVAACPNGPAAFAVHMRSAHQLEPTWADDPPQGLREAMVYADCQKIRIEEAAQKIVEELVEQAMSDAVVDPSEAN